MEKINSNVETAHVFLNISYVNISNFLGLSNVVTTYIKYMIVKTVRQEIPYIVVKRKI